MKDIIRVGVAVPSIKISNTKYNSKEIINHINEAKEKNIKVLSFPELCMTGYTCADLFNQEYLINKAIESLDYILQETAHINMVISLGMPIKADNQLFNCAVIIFEGKILGVVPKVNIPNYNEFYEARWFSSANSRVSDEIVLCNQKVPFSENLLFKDTNSQLCIGIDICEDLWVSIPPSSYHTMYGANLILNLSASNETISKAQYRKDIVKVQSAKCISAYAYCSAGIDESTTDVVFSGHSMICQNGSINVERKFEEDKLIYSDVDIASLMNDRCKQTSYMGKIIDIDYKTVYFSLKEHKKNSENYTLRINKHPFVPSNKLDINNRCKEIINIQSTGLAQRLKKINCKKAVIGISGGLDSTLALLVTVEAFKKLGLPNSNIIGVTMPGFGTTKRTLTNSLELMKQLDITEETVDIKDACILHYKDIKHDINVHNVTYENVQARERTQILMDIANKENGIVIGTGDLSELALGWCTYNGDHMSMYAVNSSIPKTLVRHLVTWYANAVTNEREKRTLLDICGTPVSPELLPPDKEGNIVQVTEKSIGSYDLHDFFLYNMVRKGFSPTKIYKLALIAFKDDYTNREILETLKTFYKRFFTQQFKRSCLPDGVKIGSICLSPRGDWRMPSDCCYEMWLEELNEIQL